MESNILVISSGTHTSIQDLGRKGYRSCGVPIAGAMDKYSAILANKLLGNEENLPVMEISLEDPKLFFEDETLIVITGADMSPKINDVVISMNLAYQVKIGDVLSFGDHNFGSRTYLAVRGGFKTEFVLGSFSFFDGITSSDKIHKGDRLKIANYKLEHDITSSKIKVKFAHFNTTKLEVTKGPEFYRLSKKQREILFSKTFEIGEFSNREVYPLKNKHFTLEKKMIITSTVIPGTLLINPDGKLSILMRDCPISTSFPRILQLTDIAINQLAQKKAGDMFKLEMESSFSFLNRLAYKFKD